MFGYTTIGGAGVDPMQIVLAGIFLATGLLFGIAIRYWLEKTRRDTFQKELNAERVAAEAQAAKIIAQGESSARSESITRREKFDAETAQARQELKKDSTTFSKKKDALDQKFETLNSKERAVQTADRAVREKEKSLVEKDQHLNELIARQKTQLLKVANLTREEARDQLFERIEKDIEQDCAILVQKRLDEAKETADVEAREIVISSIQRYASEHTYDSTISTVDIPSDDMKGRVIGREGRNIRAFEKVSGVDVIVDDTPGVVVVSCFDPVRREVARRSLEKLIHDGRIHPTRIEEVVASVQKDMDKEIIQHGKAAAVEANIRGLHQKLIELLGRLYFRTSYGQNVLKHSMEVAYLGQVIADQLGLKGEIARRAGLLHDIGKAVDHQVEGGHPQIGADLLKRYGEKLPVINAAAAHHGDGQAETIYTPIIAAADAISASRPGARRESMERYVQRLQKLEEIATSFDGVKQAYAIQAGREVRVMVDASNVDDRLSGKIARDVARRVEDEMEYPGEIKVTLVREMRYVEYAK